MEFTETRMLFSFMSLIHKAVRRIEEFEESSRDPMPKPLLASYLTKWVVFSICWGFGGDLWMPERVRYVNDLLPMLEGVTLPKALDKDNCLLDYEVRLEDQDWHHWRNRVPALDLQPEEITRLEWIQPR